MAPVISNPKKIRAFRTEAAFDRWLRAGAGRRPLLGLDSSFLQRYTPRRAGISSLAFRTNNMKTPAGRARKIAALVTMLARGETIVPESARPRIVR